VIVAAVVCLCAAGCGPGKRGREESAPQQIAPQKSAQENPDREDPAYERQPPAPGDDGRGDAPPAAITLERTTTPDRPAESGQQQRGSDQAFLALPGLRPTIPEDFSIGRLQDYFDLPPGKATQLEIVDRFCGGLEDGRILAELVSEHNRDLLVRSISYYIGADASIESYRIGAVHAEEPEPWASVRFFSRRGVAEGEIYLARSGDAWSIADIQVDFGRLDEEYAREEQFVPSSYEVEFNRVF